MARASYHEMEKSIMFKVRTLPRKTCFIAEQNKTRCNPLVNYQTLFGQNKRGERTAYFYSSVIYGKMN